MSSICDREDKPIDQLLELNDQELYIRTDPPDKQFLYRRVNILSSPEIPSRRKKNGVIEVEQFKKPTLDYLKKSMSTSNKKQRTQSSTTQNCEMKYLRYAPLNQIDLELISKLPSALYRIVQLHNVEELMNLLAPIMLTTSV